MAFYYHSSVFQVLYFEYDIVCFHFSIQGFPIIIALYMCHNISSILKFVNACSKDRNIILTKKYVLVFKQTCPISELKGRDSNENAKTFYTSFLIVNTIMHPWNIYEYYLTEMEIST